jgi:hypothetical protein
MKSSSFTRMARPIALFALLAAVLFLGAGKSAWATPLQAQAGQSVPTATPGGPSIPQVTPPPAAVPGETREVVMPGVAATIGTGDASVTLPANALSVPGTVGVRSVSADQLPPSSAGFALLGRAIEITLFDEQGNLIAHPSFANPVQVCFSFSAGDLAQAGGNADALVVQFYDVGAAKWVALPSKVNASKGSACGSVTHFTLFSLAARVSTPDTLPQTGGANLPSSLPNTGSGSASDVPMWLWIVSALALIVGGTVIFRARLLNR